MFSNDFHIVHALLSISHAETLQPQSIIEFLDMIFNEFSAIYIFSGFVEPFLGNELPAVEYR